jgi:3-hydroxybutyryl-CoA dehydrogenase
MTLERIGVIGSGTMGGGIAQVAAVSGIGVVLYDVSDDMLRRAINLIDGQLKRSVEKGRINHTQAKTIVNRITTTTRLSDVEPCPVVIEAAPEQLELKQALFRDLDRIVAPETVLATNTSTLSITQIGAASAHSGRVVGMHFFNPPPLMPLVEVIGGAETSEEVIAAILDLARQMGKTPVRVKDMPGFIVNRVARPFTLEGLRLLAEGVADHATLDKLITGGGNFRMGPFELMDLIGLDINYAASQSVYNAYFQEPRFRPSPLQQRMVESGRLGRKTGRGWYDYDQESK